MVLQRLMPEKKELYLIDFCILISREERDVDGIATVSPQSPDEVEGGQECNDCHEYDGSSSGSCAACDVDDWKM